MKKLFQLTRSVGSVTLIMIQIQNWRKISTHTLRGERDLLFWDVFIHSKISTHTLRGERDISAVLYRRYKRNFNSHAPWGAWLKYYHVWLFHCHFNSHAPWGAWQKEVHRWQYRCSFQLTRSVGSVTDFFRAVVYFSANFNSHAPWGAWHQYIGGLYRRYEISTHTLRGERD